MLDKELIGELLDGRYRVLSRLGAGGMATVFLALQESLDRHVVVKIPDPMLLESDGFRARFQLEIRALVKLRHPHVVTVLEAGELNGLPFAVIEYLEGGSLKDRMVRGYAADEPESPQEVLRWFRPVADALDFVHSQHVVHRDVKPGNLLFDTAGNAFLSDFGIAKALGAVDTNITQTGATPGTPTYMAPEAGMSLTVTGASDQYALGVVVYEALSRKLPFVGDTPIAVMLKKMSEKARDLAEIVPDLPAGAAAAVMKAIRTEPESRFPTCMDFVRQFQKELDATVPDGFGPGEADPAEGPAIPLRWDDETPAVPPADATRTLTHIPVGQPEKPRNVALIAMVVVLLAAIGGVLGWKVYGDGAGRGNGENAHEEKAGEAGTDPVVPPVPPKFRGRVRLDQPGEETTFEAEADYTVQGRLFDAPEGHVRINDRRILPDKDGDFRVSVRLQSGKNPFEVVASSRAGTDGESITRFVVLDQQTPALTIREPADGLVTGSTRVRVAGTCRDENLLGLRLDGRPLSLSSDGAFVSEAVLGEGSNLLVLEAVDRAGNQVRAERTVVRDTTLPRLTLKAPAPDLLTRARVVSLVVAVDDLSSATVEVGGKALEEKEPGRYEGEVPLPAEGANRIEILAKDAAGNEARHTTTVIRDTTVPTVHLDEFPREVTAEAVTLSGTVSEAGCRVAVSGREVPLDGDGSFKVELPLAEGLNNLEIQVTDPAGNQVRHGVSVRRVIPAKPKPEPSEFEKLIAKLKDKDEDVRAAAVFELGRLAEDAAVKPLIEVLRNDGSHYVRRAAARALQDLDVLSAVPALIDALSDRDRRVALAANRALEHFTPKENFGYREGLTASELSKVQERARTWWAKQGK